MQKIFLGDCLEVMQDIPDKSVDLICCDLPYGKFSLCKWDNIIDIEKLWEQYHRIIKDNTAILLFGKEPFSSMLRMSNLKMYRYDWIWQKQNAANFMVANKMPLNVVENISVFYKHLPCYNPQKALNPKGPQPAAGKMSTFGSLNQLDNFERKCHHQYTKFCSDNYEPDKLLPKNILKFNTENGKYRYHPTQKPVALLEYLIKTYSNEGDLILDNCCGSGSTLVAAGNLNRNFIGIEKEEKYYKIINERLHIKD